MTQISTLLVTKGHPFEKGPFFGWLDALGALDVTHVEHPAAEAFIGAGLAQDYDLWLMYDMPGYVFADGGVDFVPPSDAFQAGVLARLDAGKPILFMHHALAGWPTWATYGDIVGGRFLYKPSQVRGEDKPDSGYRHDVTYGVRVSDHAICKDIEPFTVTDELYLAEIFDSNVLPLAWSDYSFTQDKFYSAAQAVSGKMYSNEGWQHSDGSNLVAWLNAYSGAPIGYLQMGDGPSAYDNIGVTKLLGQMAHWLVSDAAQAWAKEWTHD